MEGGYYVFVVSDATGATGEMVLRAALTQFDTSGVVFERMAQVRTEAQVREVVRTVAQRQGLIVHTLVSARLREVMLTEGRKHLVPTIDLMGPLLTRLEGLLKISPLAQPGLFRQLDEDYYQRIEAINFTVKHDDGRRPHDLPQADIVLVGVSRTGKTPISIYLSSQGWQVANVPVVLGVEPPPQLFQLPRKRVVGLTIEPDRLTIIRQARLRRVARGMGISYADFNHVVQELEYSDLIFRQGRWPVIDVTGKSIEEAAAEVISLTSGERR